jgi:type IV secretory pathway VirB4 component
VLETTSSTPYFFNLHHGDLGNFTLIGPSGSGKTVVLNFLVAQAQKFAPRTFFFDKDRGAEIFIRAIGGHYDVLRPGTQSGFNPLALPDTQANRAFLRGWLALLGAPQQGPLSNEDAALIADSIGANMTSRWKTAACAIWWSCCPARSARRAVISPLASRPGTVQANMRGCLIMPMTDWTSPKPPLALT